ncbi:hypothetical protein P2Q00_35615 [Streptomyces coacervatus]|uniref:hypothetical protein n=1 Tax=Streptomyces coacervatus TaxID=647381 RepID=UPI0023D9CECA|nr:hypothetical protein [Streptomyces coacervatus]MDF2270717.1 hypothetical protein [Streptomyces coacervatus]
MRSGVRAGGEEYRDREGFLRRLAGDIRRPGFALLIAETTTLAGCAFGFPIGRDGSWWRGFAGALPWSIGQLTAAGQVFALTQVVAHPHEQNRDIADRLQERLLTDLHTSLGVTLVHPYDRAARTAFQSWGWLEIGEMVRLPGPVALRVLVLPVARSPRPDSPAIRTPDRTGAGNSPHPVTLVPRSLVCKP